jgi:hypothetical protein
MNQPLVEKRSLPAPLSLEARRLLLQRRCALQREQLRAAVSAVELRLQGIDHAVLLLRRLRLGPALLALGGAAVAALPIYRYISRGLRLVRTLRGLVPLRRRG